MLKSPANASCSGSLDGSSNPLRGGSASALADAPASGSASAPIDVHAATASPKALPIPQNIPDPRGPQGEQYIHIRGARQHNLNGFDLQIPREQLVVLTGPSGCGKSSLAFDTLHAEGQRRYLEALAPQKKQRWLGELQRPQADLIEGLPPTLALAQRRGSYGPRHTVGSVSELIDYLRVLFARLATPHCTACHRPFLHHNHEQIVNDIIRTLQAGGPEKTTPPPSTQRVLILAPQRVASGRIAKDADTTAANPKDADTTAANPKDADTTNAAAELLRVLEGAGFARIFHRGSVWRLETLLTPTEDPPTGSSAGPSTGPGAPSAADLRRDPLAARTPDMQAPDTRAPDMLALAKDGFSLVVDRLRLDAQQLDETRRERLSEAVELATHWGAGPMTVAWNTSPNRWTLSGYNLPPCGNPCGNRPPALRTALFSFNSPHGSCSTCEGLGEDPSRSPNENPPPPQTKTKPAKTQPAKTTPAKTTPDTHALAWLNAPPSCSSCQGERLNPAARAAELHQTTLPHLSRLSLRQLQTWCRDLPSTLKAHQAALADPLLSRLEEGLTRFCELDLDWLTLDRRIDHLSEGERQRVRIATQLGSGLSGVLYILDEPSAGLHPNEISTVLRALKTLRARGNSLLVVEHEPSIVRAADHLILMGPGAGLHGGKILAAGPAHVLSETLSETLSKTLPEALSKPPGQVPHALPHALPHEDPEAHLPPKKATPQEPLFHLQTPGHARLEATALTLSAGQLVVVCGVSGSGKTTLLRTLASCLQSRHANAKLPPGYSLTAHNTLKAKLPRLVQVSAQDLHGRNRSTLATSAGLLTPLRHLFAQLPLARQRGYLAERFGFNTGSGRCATCRGEGVHHVDLKILPRLTLPCPQCDGRRYEPETLKVRYRGLSIADVLALAATSAANLFRHHHGLQRRLQGLLTVGLGYLTLNRPVSGLSGGEVQRLKIAQALAQEGDTPCLYLLDDPTRGLDHNDVQRLLSVFEDLTARGHTVLAASHHPSLIEQAQLRIELHRRTTR